ncbi:hypothetical protein GGQ74_001629 [Desulfobaculum xiamenense]|uniref:DUF2721 domain-containing protein n=1 Tax=Desulfobaculum xiamenense TaxID=995050 RepID=A0A846QGN3_9BACT|nr:DUF2721 domain-containing protein [Desulfobaculum xiamenense]NJB67956.1 hypothetical protein [Desulfobaculum xiamenense]
MQITVTTPALLFPAISLLLLAYTNRFLALGARIRQLHDTYAESGGEHLREQIDSLRKRVILIRNMQAMGVFSLFLCVACMLVLFAGQEPLGRALFGASLLLLMLSLVWSLREIHISVQALNIHLRDMEIGAPSLRKGRKAAKRKPSDDSNGSF